MKTTRDQIDDVTVKLTVEIEPQQVTAAMNKAAKAIAKDVRLPGFRPGKAPRKLIEQKFGADAVRGQALDESLNDYYRQALEAEEIFPVAQPEIDLEVFDEKEGGRFTATVEVHPEFEAPDHSGINMMHPSWDVDDEDIVAQLERLREGFATNTDVDRPVKDGDYVTIDLTVSVDGEQLEDATVEDALYEVGTAGVTPKLDEELPGMTAGSDVTYTDTLPDEYPEHGGKDAEFTVTVKNVAERTLPAFDDDFAAEASEYETIDELRKSIRDGLLRRSIAESTSDLRSDIVEAYLARIDVPLPPSLVSEDRERRTELLEMQAQQMGLEVDDLLADQDTTREEWDEEQDELSVETVKATLVLDELARKLDLEVTNQDLDREIYIQAQRYGIEPQQVVDILQQNNSLQSLVGDAVRRKAIDALVESAEITDGPSDEVLIELGLKADPNAPDAATMEQMVAEALEAAKDQAEVVEEDASSDSSGSDSSDSDSSDSDSSDSDSSDSDSNDDDTTEV